MTPVPAPSRHKHGFAQYPQVLLCTLYGFGFLSSGEPSNSWLSTVFEYQVSCGWVYIYELYPQCMACKLEADDNGNMMQQTVDESRDDDWVMVTKKKNNNNFVRHRTLC